MSEMSGPFAGLGLQGVDPNPFFVPDNTYECVIADASIATKKDDESKRALDLRYKIMSGDHVGKNIREWRSCNKDDESMEKSRLRQRLESLGVPESRFDTVKPSDLIAIKCFVTVKNKDGFTNVVNVSLPSDNIPPSGPVATGVGAGVMPGIPTGIDF